MFEDRPDVADSFVISSITSSSRIQSEEKEGNCELQYDFNWSFLCYGRMVGKVASHNGIESPDRCPLAAISIAAAP